MEDGPQRSYEALQGAAVRARVGASEPRNSEAISGSALPVFSSLSLCRSSSNAFGSLRLFELPVRTPPDHCDSDCHGVDVVFGCNVFARVPTIARSKQMVRSHRVWASGPLKHLKSILVHPRTVS